MNRRDKKEANPIMQKKASDLFRVHGYKGGPQEPATGPWRREFAGPRDARGRELPPNTQSLTYHLAKWAVHLTADFSKAVDIDCLDDDTTWRL